MRPVKAPVTPDVVMAHLRGRQPYGVYLLVQDRIRALAVDFDHDIPALPMEFMDCAQSYGLPAYTEVSKSKGFHTWLFFSHAVSAAKARLIAKTILQDIQQPHTEIFPKQDALNANTPYGNYINAPLFGALVPQGRTVFLQNNGSLQPYLDQWAFLRSIQRIPESQLESIIDINELNTPKAAHSTIRPTTEPAPRDQTYGLTPCSQRMLAEGVTENQRSSCFRLAVHLKITGLPHDLALATLRTWAVKNRPQNGKTIITPQEIQQQTAAAYQKGYKSRGCDDPAITPYCHPTCPIYAKHAHETTSRR